MGSVTLGRLVRGGLAGAIAAAVWAAQEPLDQRVFGVGYSDPELLGRWTHPRLGLAVHVVNGAMFGELYRRTPLQGAAGGLVAGMAEHLATWPMTRFLGDELWGNRRAFWQATWRHALFGVLLGALESRRGDEEPPG